MYRCSQTDKTTWFWTKSAWSPIKLGMVRPLVARCSCWVLLAAPTGYYLSPARCTATTDSDHRMLRNMYRCIKFWTDILRNIAMELCIFGYYIWVNNFCVCIVCTLVYAVYTHMILWCICKYSVYMYMLYLHGLVECYAWMAQARLPNTVAFAHRIWWRLNWCLAHLA